MNPLAFIFARGGSQGLPNKNILPFCGKPLIGWSIEHALQVDGIDRVIVSTDSEEIASIAKQFGAEVPFLRPSELASDTSPEIHSWKHALNFLVNREGKIPESMVSIPATAPLRKVADIERCIGEYEGGSADVVLTIVESGRNPFFNMVQPTVDGTFELVGSDTSKICRRQDAPAVFDVATVAYVANTSFILNAESLFSGRVSAVKISREHALDIDTALDFRIAELLMRDRLIQND